MEGVLAHLEGVGVAVEGGEEGNAFDGLVALIYYHIASVPAVAVGAFVGDFDGDGAALTVAYGLVGTDAEDGVLTAVVLVYAGAAHGEVAVAASTPSEVEVEVVGVVVSVAQESVSALAAGAAIGERHSFVEVGFQHVLPLGHGILREVAHAVARVVEIVGECVGQVFRVGAATVAAVHHLHGHTAVVGETGHLCAHQRVGAGVDGGGHEVVEVDGVAEVGGEGAEVHGSVVH